MGGNSALFEMFLFLFHILFCFKSYLFLSVKTYCSEIAEHFWATEEKASGTLNQQSKPNAHLPDYSVRPKEKIHSMFFLLCILNWYHYHGKQKSRLCTLANLKKFNCVRSRLANIQVWTIRMSPTPVGGMSKAHLSSPKRVLSYEQLPLTNHTST